MYRLSCILGRVRSGRALRALRTASVIGSVSALLAVSVGCTVNERKATKAECLAGEPCGDAAADTQSEVFVGPDAHAEPSPASSEAGPTALCPTECNPEDVQTCAQVRLSQVRLELTSGDSGGPDVGLAAAEIAVDASLSNLDAAVPTGSPSIDGPRVPADAGTDIAWGASSGEALMSLPDAAMDAGPDATAPDGRDGGRGQLDVLDAAAGGGPGTAPPVLACQLVHREGTVAAECAQSGSGAEGAACVSARDCAPGLGCVGSAGGGQCLPYCCGGNDSCGEGRYCTQRPLRSLDITDDADAPTVPVCAVADNCSLMLGPCTDPGSCSCPAGLACTIVRASTTACLEPGEGAEGEGCPCAPGFFCSQGTNTCLKFCNTKDPASNCGERECQPGPSGFPMGWGLCVGD